MTVLHGSALGLPRVHHRRTDSTNRRARALAESGAPHGTLVTAGSQSAGRGRQGRAWTAAPSSALLMSLVLRGLDQRHAVLPLAAAVAVCEAAETCAPVTCRVKWPNDVWIDGRKVAGILIEGNPNQGWAVLGIGVNVKGQAFRGELAKTAIALDFEGTIDQVLEEVLHALELQLESSPDQTLGAWRERDALVGRTVRWQNGEGTAAGVDESGALLVQTAEGTVALAAGEVHLRA